MTRAFDEMNGGGSGAIRDSYKTLAAWLENAPAELLQEDQGSFGTLTPDQDALLRAYGRLDVLSKQALLRVAQRMAGPEPEPLPAKKRR